MAKYIYLNGHINTIQPYYVMYNGQRYNAAYFNRCMVFGQTSGIPPKPITIFTPFFVENITDSTETLTIVRDNAIAIGSSSTSLTIECSYDERNWSTLGTTSDTALTRSLLPGERLYLRCQTNSWITYNTNSATNYMINRIDGVSKIGGNIMSLLYGANFTGNETRFPNDNISPFDRLFWKNTTLKNADYLILPATTLANYCYGRMFFGCTNLESCDINLPATTLSEYCYGCMFEGCTSLVNAPKILPATTLTVRCYNAMFKGCTSLTTSPEIPNAALTSMCCANMFEDCTNLNYIKALFTPSPDNNYTFDWVKNVAATGTFYKKAGVTWTSGIDGIPTGWTVVEV